MPDVPEYFNRYNADLLAFIPPDAKVILEIGCGAGALCEAYRRVNPGVEWLGVENNEAAAAEADKRGIVILGDDAECWSWNVLTDDRHADCVIFGDVLEHLRDPWRVLKTFVQWAKPGAQVLACIPNVQHWTIIRDLMAGHWTYTDEGLMDRTHLRWFTLSGIRGLFQQAGLHIFEIIGRDFCNEGMQEWSDSMWPDDQGEPPPHEWRAFQYIVRAIKPSPVPGYTTPEGKEPFVQIIPAKQMHIHAITAEECCARPRIHEPFAMLRTMPGVRCTVDNFIPRAAEIVILQRQRKLWCSHDDIINFNGLFIAEIDDDPAALQGMSDDNYAVLRAVHAVQCSTERVAETCREFNPHVAVFENQIAELSPFNEPPEVAYIRDPAPFIFYGAQNRQSDWAVIMPALNRILKESKGMIRVEVVHDREFYDALEIEPVGAYIGGKHFTPFCEYAQYRKILRSCGIALLPLEPGRFNEHKSDLKFLECAAEGVCVLASRTVYWDSIVPNGRGRIYPTVDDFGDELEHLIKNQRYRQGMAKEAYAYVRDNRLLSQHFRKRHSWYLQLLATRGQLHKDLLSRCPELSSTAATMGPAR